MSGWATTYGAANKIEIRPLVTHAPRHISTYLSGYGIMTKVMETLTEAHYKYVGMDKATAATCATAQEAATAAVDGKVNVDFQGNGRYDVDVNIYFAVYTEVNV